MNPINNPKLPRGLPILFLTVRLLGADTVPHDQAYYKHDNPRVEIIYTEPNRPEAERAAARANRLLPRYEKLFGFPLDEKIYLGLMSDYNQIANGFSTQFPNNRQIDYIGGTELVDYFSCSSWLETLIDHETAHNFQLNAKDNPISRSFHAVLGNGGIFNPLFTLPNHAISPFLLEGNAVLNESWHGNGGRLYSGRFLAQTLLQVKAGHFTPARMYNDTLFFPYGEHFYTLGGQFEYFIAEKFGLAKANRFMKENSQDWYWPFQTNAAMSRAVGRDFETLVRDFVKRTTPLALRMVEAGGPPLARSKYFSSLNRDENGVFFLVSEDGVRAPEKIWVDRKTKEVRRRRESFRMGKLVKAGDGYFSQGGGYVSPLRIYQGLFDDRARIRPGTEGKMVQGFLRDGRMVYLDVPRSFDRPRLFVGDDFYATVNSSIVIDRQDNLFYFSQNNKTRTLFKNKTPLYSFEGYYGIVSDVDQRGHVYFVANSPRGSTLYRVNDKGKVERVSEADNIVEARLVSDDEALLAATGPDDYYYVLTPLGGKDEAPFETTLFFEKDPPFSDDGDETDPPTLSPDLSHRYHPTSELHYSGTTVEAGSDPDAGWVYNVLTTFADPLTQNALTARVSRNKDGATVVGVGYENTQTLASVSVAPFAVTDRDGKKPADGPRSFGMVGLASVPYLKKGYWEGTLNASYFQDYETKRRQPMGMSLVLSRSEQHGHSLYRNALFDNGLFEVADRGDRARGGSLAFQRDLPGEWYFAFTGKGSYSDRDRGDTGEQRGIKMGSRDSFFEPDPSRITMGSLRDTRYLRKALKGTIEVKKVVHFSQYFFTFPLSLRREGVYLSYAHYAIDDFHRRQTINEATAGVLFDALWLNLSPLPVNLEYIQNDNRDFGARHNIRLYLSWAL